MSPQFRAANVADTEMGRHHPSGSAAVLTAEEITRLLRAARLIALAEALITDLDDLTRPRRRAWWASRAPAFPTKVVGN